MPALFTSTSMRPCAQHGLRHQRVDLRLVADVAVHEQAAEFGGQRLAAVVVDVGDDDHGAVAREAARAGLADALRSRR